MCRTAISTTLAVPETLTALIAARLDALDETDRRIVHDAAVLGQSFTLAALAAVVGVDRASSRRGWPGSSGASCSAARWIRARPSVASTRSCRR